MYCAFFHLIQSTSQHDDRIGKGKEQPETSGIRGRGDRRNASLDSRDDAASHIRAADDAPTWAYAVALCNDPSATLDDLRESLEMFEDLERTARRVLGGAHPLTMGIECNLQEVRALLNGSEAPPPG